MNPDFDDHPRRLAYLCCKAAVELDNQVLGRGHGFDSVEGFGRIIKKRRLFDSLLGFPYLALWRAMNNGSDKELRYMDQLDLEMQLLACELQDVREHPPHKLEELRDFFVSASTEFMREDYDMNHARYLVA